MDQMVLKNLNSNRYYNNKKLCGDFYPDLIKNYNNNFECHNLIDYAHYNRGFAQLVPRPTTFTHHSATLIDQISDHLATQIIITRIFFRNSNEESRKIRH